MAGLVEQANLANRSSKDSNLLPGTSSDKQAPAPAHLQAQCPARPLDQDAQGLLQGQLPENRLPSGQGLPNSGLVESEWAVEDSIVEGRGSKRASEVGEPEESKRPRSLAGEASTEASCWDAPREGVGLEEHRCVGQAHEPSQGRNTGPGGRDESRSFRPRCLEPVEEGEEEGADPEQSPDFSFGPCWGAAPASQPPPSTERHGGSANDELPKSTAMRPPSEPESTQSAHPRESGIPTGRASEVAPQGIPSQEGGSLAGPEPVPEVLPQEESQEGAPLEAEGSLRAWLAGEKGSPAAGGERPQVGSLKKKKALPPDRECSFRGWLGPGQSQGSEAFDDEDEGSVKSGRPLLGQASRAASFKQWLQPESKEDSCLYPLWNGVDERAQQEDSCSGPNKCGSEVSVSPGDRRALGKSVSGEVASPMSVGMLSPMSRLMRSTPMPVEKEETLPLDGGPSFKAWLCKKHQRTGRADSAEPGSPHHGGRSSSPPFAFPSPGQALSGCGSGSCRGSPAGRAMLEPRESPFLHEVQASAVKGSRVSETDHEEQHTRPPGMKEIEGQRQGQCTEESVEVRQQEQEENRPNALLQSCPVEGSNASCDKGTEAADEEALEVAEGNPCVEGCVLLGQEGGGEGEGEWSGGVPQVLLSE